MKSKTTPHSRIYLDLARAFLPPEAEAPRDLALAYTQLFLGPGRPVAYLYESVFLEGRLLGRASQQVMQCYVQAGMPMQDSDMDFPDHISMELEFMAFLAEQEESNPDNGKIWREHQRRFLNQHLGRWLPQFTQRILTNQAHPFYSAAAQLAEKLIREELSRLNPPLLAEGDQDKEQFLPNPGTERSEPALSSRPQRYPNIFLKIKTSKCTLCTLCADICQTGGLKVECIPTTISLVFDPSSCNGCQVCMRRCPEHAITISRGPALVNPTARRADKLASATRVICPECQSPHISTPWLEKLTTKLGDGPVVRHSLSHCPFCKVKPASDRFDRIGASQELFDYA